MARYHVDDPIQLARVRRAIDQGAGYLDAAGLPVQVDHVLMQDGVIVARIPSDVFYARFGVAPSTCCAPDRVVTGDDGTAALELPEDDAIDAQLGRTVDGVPIPRAVDLIDVPRPRDNDRLPAGVTRTLDDRHVDDVFAREPDSAAARAQVIAELGGRAAAALARRGRGAAPTGGDR